ncbi:MAG: hypothetical protein JNK58_09385 [Phycisphaerae bacterium]|nr:hypothetical protein [Phycisphaerae bacterium]
MLHTYCNWNYGCPTVTNNAGGTGVLIVYKRDGHSTNIGVIEHYGVSLRDWNVVTLKTFRWKHNGIVVNSGHGAPPVPTPAPVIITNPDGSAEIAEAIENEEVEESIWIRRSVIAIQGEVLLEQLMIDDPIIQAATPLEVDLERLGPGETIENVEPIDMEDFVQTQVILIETFADIATPIPGSPDFNHEPGALLSRSMNATIVQVRPCEDVPVVLADPVDTSGELDGRAEFVVEAQAPLGSQLHYQWRHNGVDLVGEDNADINIDPLTPADAGAYYCVISTECGSVSSLSAYLTVLTPPICYGDSDDDGAVDFSDVTETLSHFGADYGPYSGAGDANRDGRVNFADITNVLANFNFVCPGMP